MLVWSKFLTAFRRPVKTCQAGILAQSGAAAAGGASLVNQIDMPLRHATFEISPKAAMDN
jgi:hypothetical protein